MAIKYPDIDSIGWGDDVNDNFRELSQNDTDIKTVIGTEEMGTTATTLKGAIAENTTQLNEIMNERGYVNINRISGTDLNSCVDNGLYAGNNFTNAPNNNTTWYVIEVFNCGDEDNYVIQRAMGFANAGTLTFERRKNLTTWTEWKQLITKSEVTTMLEAYQLKSV